MGRPSEYNEEIAREICARVSNGDSLYRISQESDMPSRRAMYRWLYENEDFRANYARAREDRADWRSERIDDIVERMIAGEIDHNSARIAIDAEKWQAGKEKPKRYGDKVQQEHTGADGGPIKTENDAVNEVARRLEAMAERKKDPEESQ